jgi:hypothetical protein
MGVRGLARGQARLLLSLLFVAGTIGTVISCGGGGGSPPPPPPPPPPPACRASVTSQPDAAGAGQDGGGPGGGDGSGGGGDSAGDGGPGLGQFRKALVSVEQADGVMVGEAETDDTTGMVKFVLCGFAGPVRFTVKGKADGSTQYYDESTRDFVAFPAGEEITW